MKACSLLIFGGVLLATVISTNSFPTTDGTSTTAPALTSKDGTSSVPAPPPVSPLIGSASSFTPIKTASSLGSSESDSKESDEKKSSTTAKSLFRRAADDEDGDGVDDGDDDDDEDDDDSTDESSSDTRTKRQNPSSQYDLKGSLNQSQKPKDQSSESEEKPAPVPAIAKPANN